MVPPNALFTPRTGADRMSADQLLIAAPELLC